MITVRDAYLLTMLNKMDNKLDTIMRVVSKVAAVDNTPAAPELPDDVTLPLSTLADLETVETTLTENPTVSNCMVSMLLITC